MSTYEYRIKCRNCGLHYAVFSWDENWAIPAGTSGTGGREGGYCPECGAGGSKMVWGPVEREEEIFQLIPGEYGGGLDPTTRERIEAAPMSMTAPVAESPFGMPKHMTEPR